MSAAAEVIDVVKHFTEEEKDEFLTQLRQVAFEDAGDRQLEADAKLGRLDFLAREAAGTKVGLKSRSVQTISGAR